jgi:hypothetical protein
METRRWVNQSQPQTLYMVTILLYFNAALSLLLGGALASVIGLAYVIGQAAAGYGIANERRWGYVLGLVTVGIQLAFLALGVVLEGPDVIFSLGFIFAALWPVVMMVLLLHPQSRDYQRIWFK